jgi:hypothetical protein
MVDEGHITVNVNRDMCAPYVNTAFLKLHLTDKRVYENLQKVACEIEDTATKNQIGTSSVVRSKSFGAVYIVLKRYSLSLPEKEREKSPTTLTIKEFCAKCEIRKNTVERFAKNSVRISYVFREHLSKRKSLFKTDRNLKY